MEHSSTAFHRPITREPRVETATVYERGGPYPRPPERPPLVFRKRVTERHLGNFFSVNFYLLLAVLSHFNGGRLPPSGPELARLGANVVLATHGGERSCMLQRMLNG